MLDLAWTINDDILIIYINTHDPATGEEKDADALPEIRVYENQDDTVIATGTMAKLDDANTVGFYSIAIPLLSATGFEDLDNYAVRVRAIVDGKPAVKVFSFLLKDPLENVVEGTLTVKDVLRVMLSSVALELEGADTLAPKFKSLDGLKDRLVYVLDGDGNRTDVTIDASD